MADLQFLERDMGHMKMDKNGFPDMDFGKNDDDDDWFNKVDKANYISNNTIAVGFHRWRWH